jgi:hypothetical protein
MFLAMALLVIVVLALIVATEKPSTAGEVSELDNFIEEPAAPEPTVQEELGTIAGEVSYPSDYIPPGLRVCAEDVSSGSSSCDAIFFEEGERRLYEMRVPPGRYRVYAFNPDNPTFRGYYSEAVLCGLDVSCPVHDPIVVDVAAGEVEQSINPQDWYGGTATARVEEPEPEEPASSMEGPASWSAAEEALIAQWHELNSRCRGGTGDAQATMAACEERDGSVWQRLQEAGICYGREGEYGSQMEMHRCGPDSLRGD